MVADVTFLFNDWAAVFRVLFIAFAGYVTLLALLRASGQRTLAQLSSVDFIITVTIGSAFGRVLTARDVAVVEVVAAFAALVVLQRLVAWVWRYPRVRTLLVSPPAVLYRTGEVIETTLRRKGLRVDDLRTAVRQAGYGSLDDVEVILLESNGRFSVVPSWSRDGDAMQDADAARGGDRGAPSPVAAGRAAGRGGADSARGSGRA